MHDEDKAVEADEERPEETTSGEVSDEDLADAAGVYMPMM